MSASENSEMIGNLISVVLFMVVDFIAVFNLFTGRCVYEFLEVHIQESHTFCNHNINFAVV